MTFFFTFSSFFFFFKYSLRVLCAYHRTVTVDVWEPKLRLIVHTVCKGCIVVVVFFSLLLEYLHVLGKWTIQWCVSFLFTEITSYIEKKTINLRFSLQNDWETTDFVWQNISVFEERPINPTTNSDSLCQNPSWNDCADVVDDEK